MFKLQIIPTRDVGRGHWAMPPWAPKAPFATVRRPQSRMCLQGKCNWGALTQAPSNDEKTLRKVPPTTTVRHPHWVKWRPPSPCPPPPSWFYKYAADPNLPYRRSHLKQSHCISSSRISRFFLVKRYNSPRQGMHDLIRLTFSFSLSIKH